MRIALLALVVVAFIGVILGARLVRGLPDIDILLVHEQKPSYTVLDRNGVKLGARGLTRGGFVPLADMPRHLPLAVLAVEDRRFYRHGAIDLTGMVRAFVTNTKAKRIVQGGSTITQQLAKVAFLKPERTYQRKLQEVVLALWIENKLSKQQILEIYLNRVYLGAGTYGVEAAAQRYFGKSARQLSLVESAMIAGLIKAPSYYAPTASIERAGSRTGIVLDEMVQAGFITPAERVAAPKEPARIVAAAASSGTDYVLDWVIGEVPDFLGDPKGELIVETSIDLALQRHAETVLQKALATDGAKHKAGQGAVVSMDSQGAVRVLVGGKSYAESAYNRAVDARRQPGSAFKPFVYVAALEAGHTPYDTVVDQPIQIGKWQPANYTGRYLGEMSLEDALRQSINTVAAQLTQEVGPEKVVAVARKFGIASPLDPYPSIALGAKGVGMLELTGAYCVFANGGDRIVPHVIERIRARDGKVLYERKGDGFGQVEDTLTIGTMNRMLTSVVESGTGTAARVWGHNIAGKTGTSTDLRDAWFVGYTADVVTAVWVGNDDYKPMKQVTGGTIPARIFRDFMTLALKGQQPRLLPGTLETIEPPMAVAADPYETDDTAGIWEMPGAGPDGSESSGDASGTDPILGDDAWAERQRQLEQAERERRRAEREARRRAWEAQNPWGNQGWPQPEVPGTPYPPAQGGPYPPSNYPPPDDFPPPEEHYPPPEEQAPPRQPTGRESDIDSLGDFLRHIEDILSGNPG